MDKKHSQTMRIDIPPELMGRPRDGRAATEPPAAGPERSVPAPPPLGDADFQRLFQSVYDAAVVTEPDGRIVDANPRAIDFLQRTRDELCRMTVLEVISGADQTTLKTLLESLQSDRFILIQAFCLRKDVSLFPVEIAVNRLLTGGRETLCFFIRDVTLRRAAEEMLQTVHNAIQNAGTGIAIAELDGVVGYVNPATVRLFGYESAEAMQGLELKALLRDENLAEAMRGAVTRGGTWSGEVTLSRRDGGEAHVQASVAGNRDADDQLVGMVFSFVDISDRLRAEEAERQAERQRVMMESLGAACHHLGQPSTVLLSSLELMARVKDKDKDRRAVDELLASSLAAAESLRKMLHDLNEMTEYRTVPYVEGVGRNGSDTRILAL